jgi:ATP-dependent Clp protease ATP-binding subunit ClpC
VFEGFTDGSRRAVVLAQQSAVDLRHRMIAAEHLLLGVAIAEPGAAAAALAELEVTPDHLRKAVFRVVPPGSSIPRAGHMPFTDAAKKAMELALEEAARFDAEAIDTGHVLLALLRGGGDELPAVLAAADLDAAALRPAVERQLEGRPPEPRPSQLDRIEALLTDVLARLERIESGSDRP